MAVDDPLDPANKLSQLLTPAPEEKLPASEALEAIKAAYEQARAAIEAANIQADAAIHAAQIQADVSFKVGIMTLFAGAMVIVAAVIQSRSQRLTERRALEVQRKHAAAVIIGELAGHVRTMKISYSAVMHCQQENGDNACAQFSDCPARAAEVDAPGLYIRDLVRDLGSLDKPTLISQIMDTYGLLQSLSSLNRLLHPLLVVQQRAHLAQRGGHSEQILPQPQVGEFEVQEAKRLWQAIRQGIPMFIESAERAIDDLSLVVGHQAPETLRGYRLDAEQSCLEINRQP